MPRTFGTRWLHKSNQAQLLLTFDDGPHPKVTPRVLDRLAELNARAIFFVLGREVRKNPTLLQEIVERGHVIGNHSETHPQLPTLKTDEIRDEITRCQDAVADALGAEPIYFRPPYGAMSMPVWRVAQEAGLEIVQWSNEGGEYGGRKDAGAYQIAKALATSLSEDQIILLHDDTPLVVDVLGASVFKKAVSSYAMNVEPSIAISGRKIAHGALRTTASRIRVRS